MAVTTYSSTSPYSGTQTWGPFLDVWAGKTIASDPTDVLYQIDSPYNLRPDLLAGDIYSDSNLWWVFAVRNPDVLIDPLRSFTTGTIIYIPTPTTLRTSLGI
jgi:hypothetical protein